MNYPDCEADYYNKFRGKKLATGVIKFLPSYSSPITDVNINGNDLECRGVIQGLDQQTTEGGYCGGSRNV